MSSRPSINLEAIIVDDEAPSRSLLQMMLKEHCPDIHVIGEAANVEETRALLRNSEPDVVFLDVEMPHMNGLALFGDAELKPEFETVFVTAYSQYALQALKIGAAEYLLKPVDIEELKATVIKLKERKRRAQEFLADHASKEFVNEKLSVSHINGFKMVDTMNIVYLKADNNYTEIHFSDDAVILVSKPIKEFEHKLDAHWFYRVHKSQIINLYHFKEYITKDGSCFARMDNDIKVPISRLKVNDFLQHVQKMATSI